MNTRTLILSAVTVAAISAIAFFSYSHKPLTPSVSPNAPVQRKGRSLEAARSAPVSRVHTQVARQLGDIRDKAHKRNASVRAHMEHGKNGNAAAAEEAEVNAMAMELELQDSMSSLTQQIISDPEFAKTAIAMLQAETDPEMMMMMAKAIGDAAPALKDKFPYRDLLDIALKDASTHRRKAALYAMSQMRDIPDDLKDGIAELSRTAQDTELRVSAVHTMGGWMSNDRTLTHEISETLLLTRDASTDPHVRGIVIQTIGNMDTPLSPKVFDAMAQAVMGEEVAHNRSLAALALGSGTGQENRAAVLDTLQKAYLSEPELETQRHLITQITKAGQAEAELWLAKLPTPDPMLAQDVNDYLEILASVDRKDWNSVWSAKSQRDHERGTYPSASGGH